MWNSELHIWRDRVVKNKKLKLPHLDNVSTNFCCGISPKFSASIIAKAMRLSIPSGEIPILWKNLSTLKHSSPSHNSLYTLVNFETFPFGG